MARHAFQGQLFTSDGDSVRVSISHTNGSIMLTVVGDPGELYDQQLIGLTLESTGGQGVLRTRGSGQRVDANRIRFFLDDTADIVQRRQFVRVVAAQRVVLEDDNENVILDTYAINISGGGLLLALPRKGVDLGPEQKANFYLYLSHSDDPVIGLAKVIRIVADNQLAIAFEEISRRDQERVIRFVFDRQRVALAMTRGDTA